MEELLSRVSSALGAQEFASLGNALDRAELEDPDLFDTVEWPHAVHIMAHIFANNIEDARFVYKRIPEQLRASNPDITAAFSLLQRIWMYDYEGIWPAVSYAWPSPLQTLAAALRCQLQERMIVLIQRAYSNISPANLGRLLGLSEQEAAQCAAQKGWAVEDGRFIVPSAAPAQSTLEPSEADLQKIAQYVVFLQSGEAPPLDK